MKKLFLLCAALAFAGVSQAQDVARVISSTPIVKKVGVPRQVCSTDQSADRTTQCSTQTFYENRPVGYNVVYEFGGKQYAVELPSDPGPTLQLQITPVNAGASSQPVQVVTYVQPVQPVQPLAEPPVYVVPAPAVYPGYYEPNYFWPFAFGLSFGLLGGIHGGHGGHWHGR